MEVNVYKVKATIIISLKITYFKSRILIRNTNMS